MPIKRLSTFLQFEDKIFIESSQFSNLVSQSGFSWSRLQPLESESIILFGVEFDRVFHRLQNPG